MKISIIALTATVATLSTVAIAAKVSPRGDAPARGTGLPAGQCIRSHDIRNHTILDKDTLLISGGDRSTYRVTMKGSCLAGASSSDPIITRNPPGSDIICKPIDMDIGIDKSGFETRCIVDSVVKLAPEQVAMVPKKLRP